MDVKERVRDAVGRWCVGEEAVPGVHRSRAGGGYEFCHVRSCEVRNLCILGAGETSQILPGDDVTSFAWGRGNRMGNRAIVEVGLHKVVRWGVERCCWCGL